MQKHRGLFVDPNVIETRTDIQHCLRLNDLQEVGDGTHYLDFHMLGLFSFRQMTLRQGVDFWMTFLQTLDLLPDTVSIHPDKPEWKTLYTHYDVDVVFDPQCKWSDGNIEGYCTEFYRNGVEIGNIVNPLGDCLDCGFGGERLQHLLDLREHQVVLPPTRSQILYRTVEVLLRDHIRPSHSRQGYVLRSLLRELLRDNLPVPSHPDVDAEILRRQKILDRLPRLREKYPHQSLGYFWETHGIHPQDWES